MLDLPLQSNDLADSWTSGDWLEAIFEPYSALLGEPVVGTVLGGALVTAMYIYTDDLAMPTVILLLLSGVLLSVLPGDVAQIAEGFLIVAFLAALLAAGRRYYDV